MKGQALMTLTPDEILSGLNQALQAERQAVADYATHARACGRPDIRDALEALCEVEQGHARRLELRIAALSGTPAGGARSDPQTNGTVVSWLTQDLANEQWAIVDYARLVAGIVDDDETTDLMTELLLDEIRHATWLKTTLRQLTSEA